MFDIEKIKNIIIKQHEGDERQLSVIFTNAPRVIVKAPAGYGKTTTMISRIAYLFASSQIPNPKKVLGLTFSVNAALKIKREIAGKLPELMGIPNNPTVINDKVTVTNYHGFCKSILKKYGYLINDLLRKDINSFKAIGDTDVERHPETRAILSGNELAILKQMDGIIKEGSLPSTTRTNQYIELIIKRMLSSGYITHNAIILITTTLLSLYPEIKNFYQNYYPLIIVDEFQDTNSIAWNLLEHLISPKSQLLFLGDPLQRIYGFIGALPNIMPLAGKKYNMQPISLLKNYRFRTNQEMLNLDANIRANAESLFEFHPGKRIAKLPAFYGKTQEEDAAHIATKILEFQKKKPNCKIAILCRGRNPNSETIERILTANNIQYFYGMFTDDDKDYIDFHIACQSLFIRRFGKRKNLGLCSLNSFVDKIESQYSGSNKKSTGSLLSLLRAFIQKVSIDYASLSAEDKYSLILDIFENRQLKQAMEYVNENIVLSTIHGAKGLEWEYVFISDVERWIFPNYFTCSECPQKYATFSHCKCKIQTPIESHFKNLAIDELSVFYVAITRAKNQVYISSSKERYNSTGQSKESGFSCFASLPGIELVNGLYI